MTDRGWIAVRTVLTLIVAAGLAIDAYVHLDLASTYDVVKTSTLSQGDLFRVEAALAIVAGVALLVRPRRYTACSPFWSLPVGWRRCSCIAGSTSASWDRFRTCMSPTGTGRRR